MPLGCALYGHQWIHDGPFEVRLTDEGGVVQFRCTICDSERSMALERASWLDG